MAKPATLISQVRTTLTTVCDGVGKKKDGTIVVRRGYFYRNGMDSEKFAAGVTARLAAAGIPLTVKDHGDHWTSFNGGASLANSSHFWVELA